MASFSMRYDSKSSYKEDMDALMQAVTDNVGHSRRSKKTSVEIHSLNVRLDGHACCLFLRESDLYLIGFAADASARKYVFEGDDTDRLSQPKMPLTISSRYTGGERKNLNVLESEYLRNKTWNKSDIATAIATVASYSGGQYTSGFRLSFGIFTFTISESLRFKDVYAASQKVVGSNHKVLRFREFHELVLNWDDNSKQHDGIKKLRCMKAQY